MRRCLLMVILLSCAPAIGRAQQPVVVRPVVAQPIPVRTLGVRTLSSRLADAGRAGRRRGDVATAEPAALCEMAAASAEYAARLPARLLGAISVTETGRPDAVSGRVRAWPWTINAAGEGHFYDTKQAAIAAVRALQLRGVASIDVGCMQVNLMYHPNAFASLDAAFDPQANAAYAAAFLNQLHAESRDWSKAIGAYHSETPALGDAYRVLVLARWQGVSVPAAEPLRAGAYQDFAPRRLVYGAFAGSGQAYGSTQVYGNTRTYGDAPAYGAARPYGATQVYGTLRAYGGAQAYGNTRASGASAPH